MFLGWELIDANRELFGEFGRKRKGVSVFEKFLVLHDYVRSLRGWR